MIELSNNENLLGASPLAAEAARRAMAGAWRYPDPSRAELRGAIAERLGRRAAELTLGNGSNELIDLLFRAFAPPGTSALTHEAAFVAYRTCAAVQGCALVEAPVREGHAVDVEAMLRSVSESTRIAFVANPNNPTGRVLAREEIDTLAEGLAARGIPLVLDYAYWEYVTDPRVPDPTELYRRHPNACVLRTFSKAYGLAGLRVGYLLARPEVVQAVDRARMPFNVSVAALAAARAALDDEAHVAASREANALARERIAAAAAGAGLEAYPSQGNFVCVTDDGPAAGLQAWLERSGFRARPLDAYGMPRSLRITTCAGGALDRLVACLAEYPGGRPGYS